jgi:hypothetical protein
MECEYCGKCIKTAAGLAKHIKSSRYCSGLKKRQEEAAKGEDNRAASGKDKSGLAENLSRVGREELRSKKKMPNSLQR